MGLGLITCEGVGGVQGALTLFCGGVAQAFHDDRVVELKEQLVKPQTDSMMTLVPSGSPLGS